MNNLLTKFFALAVSCVTAVAAQAQTAAPAASQAEAAKPASSAPFAASGGAPAASASAGATSIDAKIAMCLGCHNIKGYQASFPEVHKVPMIAGQNAKYIAAALTAYKNGDRKHPTMRSIATSLSEQDINEIAQYYSKLGGETKIGDQPSRQPDAQVASLLQKAACTSCHGSNFSKPVDPSYPKIAGQHADYLFVALKAYKAENNPSVGRNNAVMGAIAKQFSVSELKTLAKYVGSLDSELKTVPESRFHTQH